MQEKPHAGMKPADLKKAKDLEPLRKILEFEQSTKNAIENSE